MRFLSSDFFHESIVHGTLSNPQKYFRKIFCFRGDIREKRFFFVAISGLQYVSGGCATSGYHNPEVVQRPGNNIWRLCNLRISKPGGCTTSRLQYLKIVQLPGIVTRKLLREKPFFSNISAKTKYLLKTFGGVSQGPISIDS